MRETKKKRMGTGMMKLEERKNEPKSDLKRLDYDDNEEKVPKKAKAREERWNAVREKKRTGKQIAAYDTHRKKKRTRDRNKERRASGAKDERVADAERG